MTKREHLTGSREYGDRYSVQVENNFPVTAEDMLNLRADIAYVAKEIHGLGCTPDRRIMTAEGYSDNKGARVNIETCTNKGEDQPLSCAIIFSDRHERRFSYKYDPTSEYTPFFTSSSAPGVPMMYERLSTNDTISHLRGHMPAAASLQELQSKANRTQSSPEAVAASLHTAAKEMNLSYLDNSIYTLTDYTTVHYDSSPFSNREILLEVVADENDELTQCRLTVASHPLSTIDAQPIDDVAYGYCFSFSTSDTTESSSPLYGSATVFGVSNNPLYDQHDINSLIKPIGCSTDASYNYSKTLLDALVLLKKSTIDASLDELLGS